MVGNKSAEGSQYLISDYKLCIYLSGGRGEGSARAQNIIHILINVILHVVLSCPLYYKQSNPS